MKKIIFFALLFLVVVATTFIFLKGCGTSGTTSSISAESVVVEGKIANATATASSLRAMAWPPGQTPANSNYTVVVTTPEAYAVGLWRVRLFKTLSDSTPYTLATWGTIGSTPGHFDLSSSPTQMATNSSYPTAGTYTHMVPTLAYLQQRLSQGLASFEGVNEFRVIVSSYTDSSTSTSYQKGDVLVNHNSQWKWIDSTDNSFVATRSAQVVQVNWADSQTVEVNGHVVFEPQDVSAESAVVIPANPSGTYTFSLVFDVASTFAFNDLDGDGIFEPTTDDQATSSQESQYGSSEWNVGPPGFDMSVTNN